MSRAAGTVAGPRLPIWGALTPGEWLRKAPHKAVRMLLAGQIRGAARRRDRRFATYLRPSGVPAATPLQAHLVPLPVELLRAHRDELRAHVAACREHRFDLLGSGPVTVAHGAQCPGLEGHRFPSGSPVDTDPGGLWLGGRVTRANLPQARGAWQRVEPPYRPLDWQLDFRSGYRWPEPMWSPDIPIGDVAGADIKLPWELGRMQHLPALALAHALLREEDGAEAAAPLAREFRNQILDFIATNPPRYGVQWRNAMEAALRICSWLLAWDLLRAHGALFEGPFTETLARSVFEHGSFIHNHLEWNPVSPEARGNHYLANVVGLLFAGAYLPPGQASDTWLLFGARELVAEVGYQFHDEGSSIEGSTGYHRLSTELALFGTALLLGVSQQRLAEAWARPGSRRWPRRPETRPCPVTVDGDLDLPVGFVERLQRMVAFSRAVTKPGGRTHQVGDNDSGRVVKLPQGDAQVEPGLDHRHLWGAAAGLFGEDRGRGNHGQLDAALIQSLTGGRTLRGTRPAAEPAAVGSEEDWRAALVAWQDTPEPWRREYVAQIPLGLADGLDSLAYPVFGLYILRSERLYLGFRCGGADANHAHNDDLSLELSVDGEDAWADPGTYLYTPLPDQRNRYRSAAAHFAPFFAGEEPARLDSGLFTRRAEGRARCLYFGEEGMVGELTLRGRRLLRLVRLEPARVLVQDACPDGTPDGVPLPEAPESLVPFSPGYGLQCGEDD